MESQLGKLTADDYRERLTKYNDAEAERHAMVQELIESLEKAQIACGQTSMDFESERDRRRSLQGRVGELEKLTRSRSGRGFALVLIDADANDYFFREKFLNKNEAGGRDAADELLARVKEHLARLKFDVNDLQIVVRAYADINSLHTTCYNKKRLKGGADVRLFAHGFNQRHALFDFVDVGPGKERADNKIRECLEFFAGNWQCKHIIFGACHDSGYAPFLGRFAADKPTCERITLLKGGKIHPDIAVLGFHDTLTLESVFAPYTPTTTIGGTSQSALSAAQGRPPAASTPIPESFQSGTQVQPLRAAAPETHSSSPPMFINRGALPKRLGPVIRDTNGKRVDKILNLDVGSLYINSLWQSNLCGWYYLRGTCNGCGRHHETSPLKAQEFDYLWYVTRHGLCFKFRNEEDCDDPLCIYGHEKGCPVGTGRV